MGDAILIIGAARSGVASAEYLLSIGKEIVISDMNTKLAEDVETQLGHASVSYVWGKQPDVAALQPELIVMSPGVPLSIPPVVKARELGIPVISEPELAFRYSDVPFVAITGTFPSRERGAQGRRRRQHWPAADQPVSADERQRHCRRRNVQLPA